MGVDGGGTKSHLALFDTAGSCVGVSACGPLNHECLEGSYGEMEQALGELIRGALGRAGASASDVLHAVFGLAGVDTSAQHEKVSGMLRRIGIERFTLRSDPFLGIAAGCPGGAGICAINGTGSAIAGADRHGTAIQVGGIGEISNNCGGSGWYGSQTLGAVYGSVFKRERPTALKPMLYGLAGITGEADYVDTLTARLESDTLDMNALNRLVFDAAQAGDEVAADILRTSAAHYSGAIAYLAEKLDFPKAEPLYVTLAGSVFIKEKVKLLPRMIEKYVRAALPERETVFVAFDAAPVAGAVLWASQIAGAEIPMEQIKQGLARAGF
jgi:N-acetylglucosamine kinase-like BadF-type ATPase